MSAVSHGARHLRQGIGNVPSRPVPASRSIHIPAFTPRPNPPPSTAQRIFSETRTFFSRLVSHLTAPGLSHPVAVPPQPHLHPAHLHSSGQSITGRVSLPVRNALSRPLSAPRLPRPPTVPANVTHVGLGTARAFHSGRPIFQNIVDNVPISTRALWEAEWDLKIKKKEARKMRRAAQEITTKKTQEMLKPKPKPIVAETITEESGASELDVYFPVEPTPSVTTHLLVPLAPTPTARLPLSSRTAGDDPHPLLPISNIASIHVNHHLHSLRVSTLFARLDAANVWDDPGVNVDAYAFGPRVGCNDTQEKQCTILRVTFRGWNADRVRAVIGHSSEEWYSLEETKHDGRPALVAQPEPKQDVQTIQVKKSLTDSPSLQSVDLDLTSASELELEDEPDGAYDNVLGLYPPPVSATASAQHDLVLPALDFSSSLTELVHPVPSPPRPEIFLRTVSELADELDAARWSSASSRSPSSYSVSSLFPDTGDRVFLPQQMGSRAVDDSWDNLSLGLSSSFMRRVEESGVNGW